MKNPLLQKRFMCVLICLILIGISGATLAECEHSSEDIQQYTDPETTIISPTEHWCNVCQMRLPHVYEDGVCKLCGYACQHTAMVNHGDYHACPCGSVAGQHQYLPYIPDSSVHACICGKTQSHAWDGGAITQEPTCTTDGVKTFTCTVCHETMTEPVRAAGQHTWDAGNVDPQPTCTTDGVKTFTCTVCQETMTEPVRAAGQHVWNGGVVDPEPTCITDGVKTFTCTVCQETMTEPVRAAGQHVWNGGVVDPEPTCITDGVKTFTCTVCQETMTEPVRAAGQHTWNAGVVDPQPTCTTDGVKTFTCTACGEILTEPVRASGHQSDGGTITLQPTCTAEGSKTFRCKVCGADIRTEPIPATGHQSDGGTITLQPTCGTEGLKVYRCKVCGAELSSEKLPATGNHAWNGGVITANPTCEQTGVKTFSCTICGKTMTETIPALGHKWDAGVVTRWPTCSAAGTRLYTCSTCHATREESIPTISHKWTGRVIVDATCTEDGYTTDYCSVCGAWREYDETDALGHDYADWRLTRMPTTTTTGLWSRACNYCDYEQTAAAAKLQAYTAPSDLALDMTGANTPAFGIVLNTPAAPLPGDSGVFTLIFDLSGTRWRDADVSLGGYGALAGENVFVRSAWIDEKRPSRLNVEIGHMNVDGGIGQITLSLHPQKNARASVTLVNGDVRTKLGSIRLAAADDTVSAAPTERSWAPSALPASTQTAYLTPGSAVLTGDDGAVYVTGTPPYLDTATGQLMVAPTDLGHLDVAYDLFSDGYSLRVKNGDALAVFTALSGTAVLDGQTYTLSAAPVIKNGKLFVAASDLTRLLGMQLQSGPATDPQSVAFSEDAYTLRIGETATPLLLPGIPSAGFDWTLQLASGQPQGVVLINGKQVTALGAGAVTLQASSTTGGRTARVQLTVSGYAPGVSTYRVTSGTVNVRAGAGTNYAKLDTLRRGEEVTVLGRTGNWARIAYGGAQAFVSLSYLQEIK